MELSSAACPNKRVIFVLLLLLAAASYVYFHLYGWMPVQITSNFLKFAAHVKPGQDLRMSGNHSIIEVKSITSGSKNTTPSTLCESEPKTLTGPVAVNTEPVTLDQLLTKYPYVENGGHIKPMNCVSEQRVAFIIPYRDRQRHLHSLLSNIISILYRQLLDVTIFVIEQIPPTTFNRGALFNIGYLESQKLGSFDCFIFHDVDMIPTNDKNIYRCSDNPRHFIAGLNSYKLPYEDYFGGVVGMKREQYQAINGYSNLYFGWGGEDDDLLTRCRHKGYKYIRNPVTIGNYFSFKHSRDKGNEPNPDRFRLLQTAGQRQDTEGLNTVRYKLERMEYRPLYTWLSVHVNKTWIIKAAPSFVKSGMTYLAQHIN